MIAKAPIVSKITASPTYVKPGDSIDLSIDAKSSAKIEYVWEYRYNNGEWTSIGKDASLAKPKFKVPATPTDGAYSFRCRLRNEGTDDEYVTKNPANDVRLLSLPVFDSLSEDRTVVEGDFASIKLTAKASAAAGPAISYKWYDKSTNKVVANSDTFNAATKDVIPQGAVSKTFTYYCVADNGLTAQSKDVTVTVNAKPATITKQLSADAEYLIPDTCITLSITAQSKATLEYKWYCRDKRGNETAFGVNKESVTYLVPNNATDDSYTFVCKVRNSGANDAYAESKITLPLVPKPEVSVKANTTSAREGDTVTLTATPKTSSGPQVRYQWYIYENSSAKPISNANSSKVTLRVNDYVQWSKGAKQTLKFYCETNNGRKYKSSDIEVVVRANVPTVNNIIADKSYLKPGDNVKLSIAASSSVNIIYTWTYSLNSGTSYTLSGNSSTVNFPVPNVSSGTYRFTCKVKNVGSDENPVERTLDMPVLEAPKFSNITQSQTLRDNSKVTLTAQAISNVSVPIKYTWYTYDINGKSKIVQNASSSSTYTFDTSTRVDCNNKIYQFKFWCVADNGIQTTSSTITVSIVPPAPTKPATTEPCKPRIIELGETITLSSGITAKLAAWKWVAYRYSTCSVNKEDGTTISNSEKLTNFKFTKEGIYCISCTAENPGGSPVTVWVGPVVVTYKKTKILLPSHYVLQKNDGGGIIYPRQDG
ncbi:MAG: immunoglobulin domain-containing protein, partial [Veillonella sp.]|nr:immunoglobulin domain-containing protein [Veillonella sp.]